MKNPITKRSLIIGAIFVATLAISFGGYRAVSANSRQGQSLIHQVSLTANGASPSAISVKVGDFVEFDAKDGQTHNIAEGSGDDQVHQELHQDTHEHQSAGLESGEFMADEGYRVQFDHAGTYTFHDHLHPKISVTIIAYQAK